MDFPILIQGGMGAAVSNWRLARAVSELGQLGVVSGTAMDSVMARSLQDGDPGGHYRRALQAFPFPEVAARILDRFFREGGRKPGEPYALLPMPSLYLPLNRQEIIMAANFAEVYLAKENHSGSVGMNLLEKIQIPTLPSLYGAMLAGVDYILMGAGIPIAIPEILDRLAHHLPVDLKIDVAGTTKEVFIAHLNPSHFMKSPLPRLKRPAFLPIVSSAVLASSLLKRATGSIEGFVVEHYSAGGHNAPPRGPMTLSPSGEPVYGERDQIDFEKFVSLQKPFWLAGSYGSPEKLQEALSLGATGVQIGTAFAYCRESGMRDDIKASVYQELLNNTASIFTDPLASPTNFPFKVLSLPGTLSDPNVYLSRKRVCDLGYLRTPYLREDGSLGYRCAGENIDDFIQKGGRLEETKGRKCLCNGLLSAVGRAQIRDGVYAEPPLVTSGDDLHSVRRFLKFSPGGYSARDVITEILSSMRQPHAPSDLPLTPN